MSKRLYKIIIGGIILLLLLPMSASAISSSDSLELESDDDTSSIRSSPRTPTWPDPSLEQVYGDKFNERAIFVHQDDSTYLDDLLFCSAIPAAVHWENGSRFESMMISDEAIRENGNLIGDYSEYLRKIDSEPVIDFIGIVDPSRKTLLESYFDNVREVNEVTYPTDVYHGSAEIAKYYWGNQRQLGTDTAVLAYVPNANGGTEIRKDTQGTQTGQFGVGVDLTADELAWLRFEAAWNDPGANTDYRIGIQDPYSRHFQEYNNVGQVAHTNPTDNKLYTKSGYADLGVSPYYSYLPYKEYSYAPSFYQVNFKNQLPAGDKSLYPIPGAPDHKTFQFGPIKKGQWIAVVTEWTYYVNSTNTSDNRDFDSFIYQPGDGPGDDFLLEASFETLFFKGQTPEYGYCIAPEDGMYSVTIHSRPNSINGSFDTDVYWGFPESVDTWYGKQINWGTQSIKYHLQEYPRTSDAMTESVTNGAVVASLNNVPLLYTAGSSPELDVTRALEDLEIDNLIIIDPEDKIDVTYWLDLGFDVTAKKSDKDVFNYIYDISEERGLDKSIVLNAQGGPWFSGAAFSAAYHGSPLPSTNDPEVIDVLNQATITWWKTIQNDVLYMRPVFTENSTPKQRVMEEIADGFFNWLEGYNPDFNPDCNDANGDGVPDIGNHWDYSEDVDVIVVSPMNTIKTNLDRAINGKASVGRIPIADPSPLWAVVNREMLYWKVGFSQADNPENPNDSPPANDHWDKAGWSFVSYTHDDDDPNDDDNGDSDDDDYCGFDDGGQNHLSYRPRESLPLVAEGYGKTNDFHTYYTNVRDMLENGVSFWSQNGHGSHNHMMETGIGATSVGTDPSDPKWTGPNTPENSFIDPPVDPVSGWDWYYEIDNLHSPYIVMMACQVGGSRLPEYWLRMGAVAAVGSTVVTAAKSTSMFLDRTTRGLFTGMTFGETHRWAVDECSNVYSMHDPTVNTALYSDHGYKDELWERRGDTIQTVLYGDPDLVMISPTLWVETEWSYPRSGGNLTINITIRNQYGVLVTPDSLKVSLDSELMNPQEIYKGFYQIECDPSKTGSDKKLRVEVRANGYVSSKGEAVIVREYNMVVPEIEVETSEVVYNGGFVQTVNYEVWANFIKPRNAYLNLENTNYIRAYVYKEDDTYTGLSAELDYVNDDLWGLKGLNVSSLQEGDYYITVAVSAFYGPVTEVKSSTFCIEHILYFEGGEFSFNETYKILDIANISIYSSYSVDGKLSPDELVNLTFEIYQYDSGPTEVSAVITGELEFDVTSGNFFKTTLGLAELPLGVYFIRLTAATTYTDPITLDSDYFTIDQPVLVSNPDLDYTDGFIQELFLDNIMICTSLDPADLVSPDNLVENKYSIYASDNTFTGLNGDLISDPDGSWEAVINTSSLDEGSYYAKITVESLDYGSNNCITEMFNVTHQLASTQPEFGYNQTIQMVKFSEFVVRSSFLEASMIDDVFATEHSYEIYNTVDDTSTNISGELQYSDNGWFTEVSVDSLPAGDYYFVCRVEYKDKTVEYQSEVFTIYYDIHVNQPEVEYSRAEDTITVSGVTPNSDAPDIGYLTQDSASLMQVTIYNESGIAVMSAMMVFNGSAFYKIFYNVSEFLDEGQYYVTVVFSTYNTEEVSNSSEKFNVSFKGKDGDSEDQRGADDWIWGVLVAVIVVFIIIVVLIFILVKTGKGKVIIKWDEKKVHDEPDDEDEDILY